MARACGVLHLHPLISATLQRMILISKLCMTMFVSIKTFKKYMQRKQQHSKLNNQPCMKTLKSPPFL